MTERRRLLLTSIWLGCALAALFLYPLAAALNDDPYYLQWQRRDLAEVVAAWLLLGAALGLVTYYIWPRRTRGGLAALLSIAALPVASLTAGVLQQLPFDNALIAASENRLIRLLVPAVVAASLGAGIAVWPALFGTWVRRLLLVLSPVSLVVAEAFASSALHAPPRVAIDRGASLSAGIQESCSPVLALLFDELSYAYITEGREVRATLPGLRSLSERSTNYLAAIAPARETLVSVPSYLAARRLDDIRIEGNRVLERDGGGHLVPYVAATPEGLFGTARRLGFVNEAAGYYLAYCELLGALVDTCRSFSFYNTSRVSDRFSPVHPLMTTFVLWPRQLPFGLLKDPAFGRLQRGLVEQTFSFASRPMDGERPIFRFVHFSIPHLPFVFDGRGYHPPFSPLRTSPDDAYVRQIEYVDRLVARIVAQLQERGTFDRVTLVLLSDHGFRFGGRETMPLHVPFIVKRRGQRSRVDVPEPVNGERLLRDIVEGACTSG